METALAALVAAMLLVVGATVSGNQEALCKAMGGTYTPSYGDVCPGGSWANLFRSIPRPEPTK